MTSGTYSKTTMMILCGIFAAVTAICSLITIPLGFTPVPVNLGTLSVFLTGGILGKKYGTLSMAVYVLLGATGVPVFSGFRGGIGVLAGPTGGYIIGYIVAVLIIGLLMENTVKTSGSSSSESELSAAEKKSSPIGSSARKKRIPVVLACAAAMTAGLLICYALGTAWFMFSTSTPLWASLVSCVFPFLPGDAIKIAAAAILTTRLEPALKRKI